MCLPQASPPHAAPVPPASTAAGVSAARSDCHTPAQGAAPLLALEGLSVFFRTDQGLLPAVQGLSLQVAAGAATCLVGESGCGKSLTARAVLRLLPENAVQRGRVLLEGTDLAACTGRELRRVRGRRVGNGFSGAHDRPQPRAHRGQPSGRARGCTCAFPARLPSGGHGPCWLKWAFPIRTAVTTITPTSFPAACAKGL